MLIVTRMLAAGENAGGNTTPPTGGGAVGSGLTVVALGDTVAGPAVALGDTVAGPAVALGVGAEGSVASGLSTGAGGFWAGVAVDRSAGSEIGRVATIIGDRSEVGVALGATVGGRGGSGVSLARSAGGTEDATTAGAEVGAAADGAAADAEHATRTGNKRSAVNTARPNLDVSTRYNFSFTLPPDLQMINKPHLRAGIGLALVVFALSSCAAPDAPPPTQPAPKTLPTVGATSAPTTAAAPAPTAAPTKPLKPTDEPVDDFTPKAQSVWDTQVGPDSLKGCSGGSILPAYGLVQVTPDGNSLVWKNQEPKPYTMTRVKPGVYAYEGPTALSDGTVKMVATFTSPTTVKMTRSFTPKSEAACVHTHEYSGVFKWETAPAATPKP